jgi:hypothetical protein
LTPQFDPSFEHLSVATPHSFPVGRAAAQARLDRIELFCQLSEKRSAKERPGYLGLEVELNFCL